MIELKHVSFSYESGESGGRLRDIDLTIKDGEFILFCGASGCGKTTLTRLINGLIPNYYEGKIEGQIMVNGIDVTNTPLYEMAGIVGSVFQNPRSQFFNVDTTSELAFGCENMGMPVEEIHMRVEHTSKELNLKPLLDRSIFALSGGEKQKIACGSVAALKPEVYVLDEPSSNLDTFAIEDMRNLLSIWKAQGKTVIIAEHRLYYLHELADRVIYMESGAITREYSGKEFSDLKRSELNNMGLRVLSLDRLYDTIPPNFKKKCNVVTLSDFNFSYPHCDQVLHIDRTEVPQGKVTAVIGHNGAGKSTFARCLCGLEKKCCGMAELNGQRLKAKHLIKSCYMVMQDVNHQLFTESVIDEVMLSMEQEEQNSAEKILASLELLEFKDRHPMSLSGGQKQRVAIASAVASGRQMIVFDEPTSGLDLRHMQEVAGNLSKLADMGKCVLVVTHDPEFILSCCTHVLQIEEGKIVRNEPLDAFGIKETLDYFLSVANGQVGYKEKVV